MFFFLSDVRRRERSRDVCYRVALTYLIWSGFW